jgi:hypothetical protein
MRPAILTVRSWLIPARNIWGRRSLLRAWTVSGVREGVPVPFRVLTPNGRRRARAGFTISSTTASRSLLTGVGRRSAFLRNYVAVSPAAELTAFRLIKPSVIEPFPRTIMHGPLSFEAAFGNCRPRSHTPPVIVLDCNGIPRKSVENGGIVLQHWNCPFTLNVAIKDLQDKPEVKI